MHSSLNNNGMFEQLEREHRQRNLKIMKKMHIIGGGTVAHVTNHFAVSATAYGNTAMRLAQLAVPYKFEPVLTLTSMCPRAASGVATNADVAVWIDRVVADPATKIVFFSCALVDWEPESAAVAHSGKWHQVAQLGSHETRITGSHDPEARVVVTLKPADKLINRIRAKRKDIILVGFKTTCGASKQDMYKAGLGLLKGASCNLVLVNDVVTRTNMIVTPEEAAYRVTLDRDAALRELMDMACLRANLTFTRSTVVDGTPVPWSSPEVPDSLRTVVNYCVQKSAYKPFNGGGTVGHFAVRLSDTEFLTSIRRSDFNKIDSVGLVRVVTDGPDTVLAYGAKPSVGGQSQRIVFKDHQGFDCIVHFHCPLKGEQDLGLPRDPIPVVSQREFECGSHECGKNTSNGLRQFGNLKCVYLHNHGPNIVFNRNIDPQEVIDFIEANFDLSAKTDGLQTPDTSAA